jgi:protein involved in polysaccharide export with SLBB domain
VKRFWVLWLLIPGLLVLGGCSATGYPIADLAAEINATRSLEEVKLKVGDVVRVSFPYKAEWNHEARVRPDGSAAFLLLDDQAVVGLTLDELDRRLSELYLKKVQANEAAEVTVDLPTAGGAGGGPAGTTTANDGRVIYVVGEVENPGAIPGNGRTLTLTDAIAAAGGHKKATANLSNTILVRRLATTGEMKSWRLDADIFQWGSHPAIYLQDRDVVFVPNTAIDEVDIWVDQYLRQLVPFPFLIPVR